MFEPVSVREIVYSVVEAASVGIPESKHDNVNPEAVSVKPAGRSGVLEQAVTA